MSVGKDFRKFPPAICFTVRSATILFNNLPFAGAISFLQRRSGKKTISVYQRGHEAAIAIATESRHVQAKPQCSVVESSPGNIRFMLANHYFCHATLVAPARVA